MQLEIVYQKEDSERILNEIRKNVHKNKEMDFNRVLDIAFRDLKEKFHMESINVFLLNKDHTHLMPYRLYNPSLPEEVTQKIYQMPIPLVDEPGVSSYIIQKKMNVYIPELKPEFIFSEWGKEVFRLTQMKSNLLFPLFVEETVCGIITFPTYEKKLVLSAEQIEEIKNYVFYISIALTSMFYSMELKEKTKIIEQKNKKMKEDLKLASKIQQSFIPSLYPVINGIRLASFYKPMEEIGGDFYDFISIQKNEKIGIFISDVSGHGVPAALITSMIKTLIETSENYRHSASTLLSYINKKIYGQTAGNFLTAFYGIYDSNTRVFSYAKGAHNPPILLREKEIIFLESKGKMLGIFPETSFEEKNITLLPGDKVLFYTDGLTEAINEQGIDFESVLYQILKNSFSLSGDELLNTIYHQFLLHQEKYQAEDDVCVIIMEIL